MKKYFLLVYCFLFVIPSCTQPLVKEDNFPNAQTELAGVYGTQTEEAKPTSTSVPTNTPYLTQTPTSISPLDLIKESNFDEIFYPGDFPSGIEITNTSAQMIKVPERISKLAREWVGLKIDCGNSYGGELDGVIIGFNDTLGESKKLYSELMNQYSIDREKIEEYNLEEGVIASADTLETSDGTILSYSDVQISISGIPDVIMTSIVFQNCYFAGTASVSNFL